MTPQPAQPRSLRELHDIVLPESVAWWPPAPGWFVLAAVVLVASAWTIITLLHRRRMLAYQRAALAELRALRTHLDASGASPSLVLAAGLLKRTAMHVHTRSRVASLHGEAWWRFLDEHGGEGLFAEDAGPVLSGATYGDDLTLPLERAIAALDAVERWIAAQGVPMRIEEAAL